MLTVLALSLAGPMAIGIKIGKRHALCSRRFGPMRPSGVLGRTVSMLLPLALIMLMGTVILIQMGNMSSRDAAVGRKNYFPRSSVCVDAFAKFLVMGFVIRCCIRRWGSLGFCGHITGVKRNGAIGIGYITGVWVFSIIT